MNMIKKVNNKTNNYTRTSHVAYMRTCVFRINVSYNL